MSIRQAQMCSSPKASTGSAHQLKQKKMASAKIKELNKAEVNYLFSELLRPSNLTLTMKMEIF